MIEFKLHPMPFSKSSSHSSCLPYATYIHRVDLALPLLVHVHPSSFIPLSCTFLLFFVLFSTLSCHSPHHPISAMYSPSPIQVTLFSDVLF